MTRPSRVIIDLKALKHNFSQIKKLTSNSKVMAIVKADAYGHGLVRVASALCNADAFGVACIEEAEQLADRVGVIHEGKIIVVEKTSKLLEKLGKKTLKISIKKKTKSLKFVIKKYSLKKSESNYLLNYDINDKNIVSNFFKDLNKNQIEFEDLEIKKSSLEEVFLNLIDK